MYASFVFNKTLNYKNYTFNLENDNEIVVCDIHSDYREELEFNDGIVSHVDICNDRMILIFKGKVYLYELSNLTTPTVFDLPHENILFCSIKKDFCYFVVHGTIAQCFVHDFLGKQIKNFKLESQQ